MGLRVAMLAPVAWRVPPRHYGPWEQFASLLTEGLVSAASTSRSSPSGDSLTAGRLSSVVPRGWEEDPDVGAEGGRVPPHLGALRARRRVRPHPQQLRLPAADLQRAGLHARADHDPRLLVAGASWPCTRSTTAVGAYVAISDADRHPRLDYLATIHHGIDTDAFALDDSPAATCCSSAASIPTRALPMPSRSPAGPACHW